MRVLLQRVGRASVHVEGERVAAIGRGLLLLVGVAAGDAVAGAERLAEKTAHLRLFEDASGRLELSALDLGAEALVVSQFTLLADTRKGRRPSFTGAARPEEAAPLVERYAQRLDELGLTVGRGRFGAHMQVELVNDGPVTLILEG
jgi:D-tyrosyl-tRNA(Tyr) deacylase